MKAGARPSRSPKTQPGRQTTLGPGASTVLRATVAEIARANEREHGELASSAPSAVDDADPDGVAYAAEYHGSEYDDEYVTVEEFTGTGRGITPNLVVCPCVEEGTERWTVSILRPASVAGVESKRQATERQRDRLFRDFVLATVAGYLVKQQGIYLDSGDPADLEPILQKDIAANIDRETERTGECGDRPGRWKIDKTRVSGALASLIELPWGQVVPLRALAPNRLAQLRRFIAAVFRQEDRPGDGVEGLVGRADLNRRVGEKYHVGENNIRRAIGDYHLALPLDPKQRMEAYRKGDDWWTHRRF